MPNSAFPAKRSLRRKKRSLRFLAITVIVFVVDRVTKLWIYNTFQENETMAVFRYNFHITFVKNTGAAFGMFREHGPLLITISIAFILFFTAYVVRNLFFHPTNFSTQTTFSETIIELAWPMVIGGALGNLYDRIFHGYVIDFIDFRIWPVFNFADIFIFVGFVLMFFASIRK